MVESIISAFKNDERNWEGRKTIKKEDDLVLCIIIGYDETQVKGERN